jgi:hypothetical protein
LQPATDQGPSLVDIDQIALGVVHDRAGAGVDECLALATPITVLTTSNLEKGPGSLHIDLVQQGLVTLEDRRGRSVDDQVRLDGAENLHHGVDGGNVAIVVSRAGQTVVRRAQVHD